MDPDNNRTHLSYNPNLRNHDRPIPPGFPTLPQMPNNMVPMSYMYSSLPHIFYPTYPYSAYPYSGSYLPDAASPWRDSGFAGGSMGLNTGYPRNYIQQQNSRVTLREPRDHGEHEVINLESDEQNDPVPDPQLPILTAPKKQSEKPVAVIEIDDNSPARRSKPEPAPTVPKPEPPSKLSKKSQDPPKQLEKEEPKPKPKPKADVEEAKTKQIRKVRKRNLNEVSKEERSSREKVPTRTKPKQNYKEAEKQSAKKSEKTVKLQSEPIKKKQEESVTREIAKYMESHGEIRHGKEFQSYIPNPQKHNSLAFRAWIQSKRKSLLARECGPTTY